MRTKMTKPTTMTELEAVNVLLTTIGESPVSTLSGNQVVDVAIAQQVLLEVSREVQSMGWHFNTDVRVELSPDVDSFINVPTDTARIDITNSSDDIVSRDGKLYNLTDKTFVFTDKVEARLVYFYDFEKLPDVAKKYITTRASRIYADRLLNSQAIHKMISRDEAKALVDLREYEGETADYNMNQNYSVARVLNRGNYMRYGV